MNSMVIDLMGIYVPTFGVLMALVFIVMFFLRQILDRFNFFSLFWHRGLIEVSIFILLMGGALLVLFAMQAPLPPLHFSVFDFHHYF